MPKGPVTVTATEIGPYYIATKAQHGTVIVEPEQETYCEGDVITLSYETSEEYEAKSYEVIDKSGKPVTVQDNQFIMPESSVTVTAVEVVKSYNIAVTPSEYGTIKVSASAMVGQTVEFEAVPVKGYKLYDVAVIDSKGNPIPVDNNTFVMPASNVTIVPDFVPDIPDEDYLNFTPTNGPATIKIVTNRAASLEMHLVYSTDKVHWNNFVLRKDGGVTVSEGTTVYFKIKTGEDPVYPGEGDGQWEFEITGNDVEAGGNIMSLVSEKPSEVKTIESAEGFRCLFYRCTALISAPKLPATNLSEACYEMMFCGCTNLKNAPELPAIEMKKNCYNEMFTRCTSLKTPPKLPATKLAETCYGQMFCDCYSLETTPELPAKTLANYCYYMMFSYCEKIETAPELPAQTLNKGCYEYMFQNCTSLKKAPNLPVKTLVDHCYYAMFVNCTSLVEVPEFPATKVGPSCCVEMFAGCESLTTFPSILPAEELEEYCYYYMFEGCNSLTVAPTLPAKNLANNCYGEMFKQCTSLKEITVSFSNWNESGNSTKDWVKSVGTEGVFICPDDLVQTQDASHVPVGWNSSHSYGLDITNPEHGTIQAKVDGKDVSEAEEGTKVQLVYKTTSKYELDEFQVKLGDVTIELDSDNTFIMPRGPVTITATEIGFYDINIEQPKHGEISVSPVQEKYYEGDAITLGYESEEGYELSEFYATDESGEPVEVQGNHFVMPDSDVTVGAVETPIVYDINVVPSEHGKIDVAKHSIAGNTIVMTPVPEAGYTLYSVSVTDSKGKPVSVTNNSFVMPIGDVTVTAEFGEDDPGYIPEIKGFETWAPNTKQINIAWNKSYNPKVQYWLYKSTVPYGDWGAPIKKFENGQTSYTDTDIVAGTKYYYMMRGAVLVGDKYFFGEYTKMDYGYPRVEDMQRFEAWASGSNRVNLHWLRAKNPDVVYFIYRGYQPYGDWGDAIDVLSNATTDYRDTGYKPGVKNYYMARPAVLNADGTYSFGEYTRMDYAWPR